MLSTIELRHLHAVIALAEELNFTRAALRLHISQPALSKQITELEQAHGFPMFIRTKKRFVELTDAGSAFVAEAKASIMHLERAGAHGRAAHEGSDDALIVGYSPHTDRAWIAAVLANHLPLYPRLQIRLLNQFSMESVRSVMMGALDFALVMAPPQDDPQITAAVLREHRFMLLSRKLTSRLRKSNSFFRIWRTTRGFCFRSITIPSCTKRSWTRRDATQLSPSTPTMSSWLIRLSILSPSILAWRFWRRRCLAIAVLKASS